MDRLLTELNQIQRIHAVQADYEKTLALLASIKSGAVSPDQVNLFEGGWKLADPIPPEPAVPVSVPVAEALSSP